MNAYFTNSMYLLLNVFGVGKNFSFVSLMFSPYALSYSSTVTLPEFISICGCIYFYCVNVTMHSFREGELNIEY